MRACLCVVGKGGGGGEMEDVRVCVRGGGDEGEFLSLCVCAFECWGGRQALRGSMLKDRWRWHWRC